MAEQRDQHFFLSKQYFKNIFRFFSSDIFDFLTWFGIFFVVFIDKKNRIFETFCDSCFFESYYKVSFFLS